MKQALEMALDWIKKQPEETPHTKYDVDTRYVVLKELEAALAQPEQEPVVWTEKVGGLGFKEPMPNANYKVIATIAPQRKPLTDEQIDGIASKFYPRSYGLDEFARAIEAAHGIKE